MNLVNRFWLIIPAGVGLLMRPMNVSYGLTNKNMEPGRDFVRSMVRALTAVLNPTTRLLSKATHLPSGLPMASRDGMHPRGPTADTKNFRAPQLYNVCTNVKSIDR